MSRMISLRKDEVIFLVNIDRVLYIQTPRIIPGNTRIPCSIFFDSGVQISFPYDEVKKVIDALQETVA